MTTMCSPTFGTRPRPKGPCSPPLVHVCAFVCRSGMAEANRWIAESHNVAADYLRAFGKQAPHVKGLRLQINSQRTGSAAESYFADLVFRDIAQ